MIKNEQFELVKATGSDGPVYRIVVHSAVLANRLNRALGMYYDTKIKVGEEPLFLIREHDMRLFLDLLTKRVRLGITAQLRA